MNGPDKPVVGEVRVWLDTVDGKPVLRYRTPSGGGYCPEGLSCLAGHPGVRAALGKLTGAAPADEPREDDTLPDERALDAWAGRTGTELRAKWRTSDGVLRGRDDQDRVYIVRADLVVRLDGRASWTAPAAAAPTDGQARVRPVFEDGTGHFLGHEPRECTEHRTVGAHRAWCFDCTEWCYPRPAAACRGCELPYVRAREGVGAVPAGDTPTEKADDPAPVHDWPGPGSEPGTYDRIVAEVKRSWTHWSELHGLPDPTGVDRAIEHAVHVTISMLQQAAGR